MDRPDAGTRVIVVPLARQELRAAYLWYRRDNPQAAAKFQADFQEALVRLAEAPLRWAEVEPGVRRFLLPHYPYTPRYAVADKQVQVLSVVHHARHPDHGRGRR